MKDDLIFHLVKKEEWKASTQNSRYQPEYLDSEGFIHCSTGRQVQDTANRLFHGEDNLMLVVINTTLLSPDLKYEQDEERNDAFPHIYGPLNTDAVIDKIELAPEEDGSFNITFSEN